MDRGISIISLYTGEIDEEKIENMSYIQYCNLIREITLMFNYQAAVNLMGNSYAGEVAIESVNNANPMKFKENNNKPQRLTMSKLKSSGILDAK